MKVVLVLLLVIFAQKTLAEERKLSVFVGIPPQAYFVNRIAGDLVELHTLMPASQNPVTYEPRPKQIKQLYDADIFFQSGVPFEQAWFSKNLTLRDSMTVIACCDQIALIEELHEHQHDGHVHEFDPHYWTSPLQAKIIAQSIYVELAKQLPKYEKILKANYQTLLNELNDLNDHIRVSLQELNQRSFMISHPAWGYFAKDYGLEQISLEKNGKSIRARQIIQHIELAKELKMQAVYSQPQFNQEAAELIAKGADIEVIELDPMHSDYINNLYQVTDNIVKGLSY